MKPETISAMISWCNRGNPSSGYESAKEARQMMTDFRTYIGDLCQITTCCVEDRDRSYSSELHHNIDNELNKLDMSAYKILFTSGASEANCTILRAVIDAYTNASGLIPHIIMSSIEHKSLILAAENYEKNGLIEVSFIAPTISGHILPSHIESKVQNNTCLICVMHANNETGAINDIARIGAIAHKYNIPFHCDTVQTFGKYTIWPDKLNIDSLCVSFHKFGGPPGIGALIIRQKFLIGYQLLPLIFGTQNEGYRGGTENLPGIGAALSALKITFRDRSIKNKHVSSIKKYIMTELGRHIPTRKYTEYVSDCYADNSCKRIGCTLQPNIEIVFMSAYNNFYLHNTILLSVIKRTGPRICNVKLKNALETRGIIVSVGSACNTSSKSASHVLYAMNADEYIRAGALRISLCDDNTLDEAKKFVSIFIAVIHEHIKTGQ